MSSITEQVSDKIAFLVEYNTKKRRDENGDSTAEELRWLIAQRDMYNHVRLELLDLHEMLVGIGEEYKRCSLSSILDKKPLIELQQPVAIRSLFVEEAESSNINANEDDGEVEEEEKDDSVEDPSYLPSGSQPQAKKRRIFHCSECGMSDHNKRSCAKRRRMSENI
jgi:hypothetical protein